MDFELTNEIKQLKLIAAMYGRQRKFRLAEKTYQQLVLFERREYGEFSSEVAASIYDLAEILRRQEQHEEARSRYEDAIAIWERLMRLDLLTAADRSCYLDACSVLQQYKAAQEPTSLATESSMRGDVIS
jgi:tetratricopeptide (TPR) repeat protein